MTEEYRDEEVYRDVPPAEVEAVEAPEEAPQVELPDGVADLLKMETVARDAAANYPDGPNCDAVKAGLTAAAHGIAHVRKALANNARLADR